MFLIVLLLVLVLPTLTLADKPAATASEYQAEERYAGTFKWERLYKFHDQKQTWFASKNPRVWSTVPCYVARDALRITGHWLGNLAEDGTCAGYAEAPEWAAGNYLNFLRSGQIK